MPILEGLFHWKGCDTLLNVIENLSHTYKNITLNIYGFVESHYYKNDLFIKLKQSERLVEHGLLDQVTSFQTPERNGYLYFSFSFRG